MDMVTGETVIVDGGNTSATEAATGDGGAGHLLSSGGAAGAAPSRGALRPYERGQHRAASRATATLNPMPAVRSPTTSVARPSPTTGSDSAT